MENEHWITAIDNSFQRILRWIYPGVLFFVLLYISNDDAISNMGDNIGFSGNIIWILLIGSFGVGSIIYLIEQYVINDFIALVVTLFSKIQRLSDIGNKTGDWLFGGDARKTKARYESKGGHEFKDKLSGYMDYSWGACHALAITGYLIFVFEFISASELFSKIHELPTVIASILVFFALLFNVKLRVYHRYFFGDDIDRKMGVK